MLNQFVKPLSRCVKCPCRPLTLNLTYQVRRHLHLQRSRSLPGCERKWTQIADKRFTHLMKRCISTSMVTNKSPLPTEFEPPQPRYDWDYLLDPNNIESIEKNIQQRKGVGDISKLHEIWKDIQYSTHQSPENLENFLSSREADVIAMRMDLYNQAALIPNKTHPDVPIGDESQATLVDTCGTKQEFEFEPKGVTELAENMGLLRTHDVGHTTGPRSYYFLGDMSRLEHALIKLTLDRVHQHGFSFVSVPDIVHPSIVESCGVSQGEKTLVYTLEKSLHGDACLAGTGEIPLAAYFMNNVLDGERLPYKVATVSNCYRAETAKSQWESGIYRVHQFAKVEMFGVTGSEARTESDDLVREIVDIQKQLYTDLGLHFRVLNMPSQDLGAPAYRKFDIEAWMPAVGFWGELSSASNCTDYQSRRLNIRYVDDSANVHFAHTVNGTGCATPRMMMAIFEQFQNQDGTVNIPDILRPYMGGRKLLTANEQAPRMKWVK